MALLAGRDSAPAVSSSHAAPTSSRRRRATRVAAAAVTAVLASTLAPAAVLPAHAAVAGMSAVDPQNGFPTWYSDGNVKLQLCYMAGAGCLSEPPDPSAPASYPDNFPEEAFWFNASATQGNLGVYEASLEGAHVNGPVVPGEQMGFGRLRFRVNNLVTGAQYTIKHPYGTNTFTASAGRINATIDAGTCAPTTRVPCDWAGVGEAFLGENASTTTSTFVTQVGAAAGTLGDINTARPITGAPSGTNAVIITGPNAGGQGVNTLTVNNFTVQGLIFNGADAAPSTPDLAAASDSGRSATDNITNVATPTFTGTVPGIGATEASVQLLVDGATTPAVDGATLNGAYSLTLPTSLGSGVHRVQARTPNPAYSVDPATGLPVDSTIPEFLTSGTFTFTVDTTPPPVAIATPKPSNPSADTTPTVPFTGEAGATTECQLMPSNPDWSPCASPMTYDQQLNGLYTFNVRGSDAAGNVSAPASYTWRIGPADTTAPTAPGTPAVTSTGPNSLGLTWAAATDNVGVDHYDVFRDGGATAIASPTTTSFTDTGLAEASSHSYVIKAVDAAGLVSAASLSGSGRTADVTAPSAPATPSATAAGTTSITVRWAASTDNVGVTGYRVYRDGVATAIASPAATATSYTDSGLTAGSTHTYEVAAVDQAGNLSAKSLIASATTTAAPTDTAAPTQTHTPATGATGVAVTGNVTATFNEPVQTVNGTTFTLRSAAGTAVAASVTAGTVANQWVLNPTADLAAGTTYTATLTGGTAAIRDASNNPLATTSWTFTTAPATPVDTTAPTQTHSPATGATSVAVTSDVTTTFNEPVQTVNGTTFTLRSAAGTAVAASVTAGTVANQWVLNPTANLAAGTTYTATLTGGATAIRDASNNPLATASWTFTTAAAATTDVTKPTATVAPTANSTGASQTANITATFSEAVTGVGATTFTLKNAATGAAVTAATAPSYNATTRVATFDPSITLAADTKYTASLTAGIKDTVGNTLTATSWTFTTGPRPAMAVGGQAPANGATAVSSAANITANFTEPVLGVTSTTFTVKNTATGAVVAAPAPTRVGTTNQWLVNPTANLANDTKYTVTLTGGAAAIRDAAGNTLSSTGAVWTFTTGPAPTVTARTPAVNALNVGRTANVTATFSENITGWSATTVTLKSPTGVTQTAVVSYNATTRVLTLNPSATLAANTKFTVALTGGTTALRDIAGNPLATTTWSFTTGAA